MTVLQTLRLTLSPCTPDDRADFMDLERDPVVMRFLNGGYAVDHQQVDPNATFLMPRGTEPYVWTAWPESEQVAEIGYRLARMDWGQGLACEGASALIEYGFQICGYEKIVATTMAVNHASPRVMEKSGLSYARTEFLEWDAPIPGSEEGDVWYEIAHAEWRGK
jgi:Acetyltransferase (GNAT) domain